MALIISDIITLTSTTEVVLVTEIAETIEVIEMGPQGPPGPQGDPGIVTNIGSITVGNTEPIAPQINDLWIDTSV